MEVDGRDTQVQEQWAYPPRLPWSYLIGITQTRPLLCHATVQRRGSSPGWRMCKDCCLSRELRETGSPPVGQGRPEPAFSTSQGPSTSHCVLGGSHENHTTGAWVLVNEKNQQCIVGDQVGGKGARAALHKSTLFSPNSSFMVNIRKWFSSSFLPETNTGN